MPRRPPCLPLGLMLIAAGPLASTAGWAQTCRPERVATIAIEAARDTPVVTIAVGGQPVGLLLDTGAERSILTDAAARRLGLTVHSAYPMSINGVGGTISTGEALLEGVSAGGRGLPPARVRVGPVATGIIRSPPVEGLLGADILTDYDLDIDLPHGRLGLFRPAACQPAAPGWKGPYQTLEARRSLHNRLFFTAEVNGHAIAALIDTGAQVSVLDSKAAAAVGVRGPQLADDPAIELRGSGGGTATARRHLFGAVRIGQDPARPARLLVAPIGLLDADLVLGVDFLATRRAWLAYAAHRIFLADPGTAHRDIRQPGGAQ